VWTIALSLDGKKVVSGSEDGLVRVWDMDTCKVIAKWTGHTRTVSSVCWSPDGQQVVSGSEDGTVREWDVEKGETILGPIETGHEQVFAVVYSPDMTMFATGGWDGPNFDSESKIKIWDLKTGKLVATLKGHTNGVRCLAWTPDGKTLISGSNDYSIRTWNTSNWKQIAVFDGHTSLVYNIAISPNGRILASASYDNTARLWNLDNNQPINSPLNHTRRVTVVSFSADGKLLATGCDDLNAYTWDVSAISKQAGLDNLLLDKPNELLLVVREIFIHQQSFKLIHSRLMLHDVLSDASQSRSPLGYPEAFSTTYLIVLTYVVNYLSSSPVLIVTISSVFRITPSIITIA
jgi:WD40 repeat protein